MGHERKLTRAQEIIADLEERLRVVTHHAWTVQLALAGVLHRFCPPNGSCVISTDLLGRIIDEEWGVRTDSLPDKSMAVVIEKPREKPRRDVEGATKAVIVAKPPKLRR